MSRHLILVAGLALSTALAGCVPPEVRLNADFTARNNLRVVPEPSPEQFTVLSRGGAGGSTFFCAAADYAFRRLGESPSRRVVVVEPVGQDARFGGTRSVVFTVASTDEVPDRRGFLARVDREGESLTIAHARKLCSDGPTGPANL